MGFWHTGYMEFHEPTGGFDGPKEVAPPTYPCSTCAVEFSSLRDLRVHEFAGHTVKRPVLVYDGRECGRSRLTITRSTTAAQWSVRNAKRVSVNGRPVSEADLPHLLAATDTGVIDVCLSNGQAPQNFQFHFCLSNEEDLAGVDAALDRLIASSELSLRAIDDFIMRSRPYHTAQRYLAGLADYLYGVLAREASAESESIAIATKYEAKYDQAVVILSDFDRRPAEAICGIVALHYNQFNRSMSRTKSQRVAEVALRLQGMVEVGPWPRESLLDCSHGSLDFALSDSTIEQVLTWCAMPLDGTGQASYDEIMHNVEGQRPADAFKLRMLAAEHALTVGDSRAAGVHAEQLRHTRIAEQWYGDFRRRLDKKERESHA